MEDGLRIHESMDITIFRNTYYLKSELFSFCKGHNLPTIGSKEELTKRIEQYISMGKVIDIGHTRKAKAKVRMITLDSIIESPFFCSEKHRAFFKKEIGNSFKFNVLFQQWLKVNSGKTYREAVKAYYEIKEYKRSHKAIIGKQFEYNTYIRDFFVHNQDKSLEDAIKCWKYKKKLLGSNQYEKSDLIALSNNR